MGTSEDGLDVGSSKSFRRTTAESSGGIVYRITSGQIEVALVGRTEPRIWALPKGTPARGETREQTALREVQEETGLTTRILEPIGNVNYWFVVNRRRINKTVYYYLMEPTGGDVTLHDPEYDLVEWFPIDRAIATMSYQNEIVIVRQAQGLIERRQAILEPRVAQPT